MSAPSLSKDNPINVKRLIESRLLVQANSGAGKSWALRRLLEQTYGAVQQIVIDVEGEFHTLREKFDYILAGQKGGDCPADTKSAALLARRLLELNVSAIVDIYELGTARTRFVRLFLDALVNAPRELWHPTLVVLDEAHMFAPEAGQAESADAVKDLMTRGRKRGFCGVLATQRISKLHKDAAAECNNKLIGRSSLDIDMKRAASELGFTSREDMQKLRTLAPGAFYAFGPALSDEVRLVKIGAVQTTHPKAGERAAAPTPPREKVKRVLAQLADLPHEAEEEARSVAEWRAKAKQLEVDLRKAKAAQPAPAKTETKIVEKPVLKDAQLKRIERVMVEGGRIAMNAIEFSQRFAEEAEKLRAAVTATKQPIAVTPSRLPSRTLPTSMRPNYLDEGTRDGAKVFNTGILPAGEAAILRAVIQYAAGLDRQQLTVLTGYKRVTRNTYIARLRERGLVDLAGERVTATDDGIAAMPDAEPLPTGTALQDYWLKRLPRGEGTILAALLEANGAGSSRDDLTERTGYKRVTRNTYLSRLAAKELVVEVGPGIVRASPTLFEVA